MVHNVTLLDGAMGTLLWERSGEQRPVWEFNLTQPHLVKQVHGEYLAAGSQIILSNTFAANGPAVSRSRYSVEEVMSAGVMLAREAAEGKAAVAMDVGPLTAMMEPYGDMTEEEVLEIYTRQIDAGMTAKPDCIWFETFLDLNMLEIAVQAAKRHDVPVFATMAFEAVGRTMMGNRVEDMIETLSPYGMAGLGLNCNLTPEAALSVLRRFRENTDLPLIFKPNAGKAILDASGMAHSDLNADAFARDAHAALPYADYIGGCCGTTPETIARLCALLQ